MKYFLKSKMYEAFPRPNDIEINWAKDQDHHNFFNFAP